MKLAAYFARTGGGSPEAVVRRMLQAQAEEGAPAPVVHAVEGGALGWLSTSDAHAPFPLAHTGRLGNVLLVSGTPVALSGTLPALLARAVELGSGDAERVLTELDGAFAAVHWDAAAGRLTAVTDFLGMQPLYVSDGSALTLSTDLRGIVAAGTAELEPDPAGWGAFFTLGHAVGDLTFFTRVKRAPAGAVTTYDARGGGRTQRSYWRWPEPEPHVALADVDTGAIVEALSRSAGAYRRDYRADGVVLMSGGFDSRLVLHLLKDAGAQVRALVVRHRDENDDADGRYAVRAAEGAGVPYQVATPPRDFYGSAAYRRYLWRSEAANPSFGLFIAQVSAFITPEMRAVWDGLAPQAMRRLGRNSTGGGFDAYLAPVRRNAVARLRGDALHVFTKPWAESMYEAFTAALDTERRRYRDDAFGVAEFSVRNRTRHRIGTNPFKVYAGDVLPFTPGLTREYYALVGRLSEATKGKHDLTLKLFREHFPAALRIPFCSGSSLASGARVASPSFLAAQWRARLLKQWYARRALERLGLLTPFTFDLAPAASEMLRRVDFGDARLRPGLADAAAGLANGAPSDGGPVMQQLFYWQAVRSLAG